MIRIILAGIVFLFSSFSILAQVFDDFSDGDISNNPTWLGDVDDFIVNGSFQLQLDAEAVSDTSALVIPGNLNTSSQIIWEFLMELDFDPSNVNNMRFYLMSDQSDLKDDLNGYFLRIGENGSEDGIRIFRQQGSSTSATEIFNDGVSTFPISPVARIRIVRESNGIWNISSDPTGGTDFIPEGSFTDDLITSTAYSGFFLKYTESNSTAFRFDDVSIQGEELVDDQAPVLQSVEVESATNLSLVFNEALEASAAENTSNYNVTGIGNPITAALSLGDPSIIELEFGSDFPANETQTIEISGISDLNGNTIDAITEEFTYIVAAVAMSRDVVFNEIFADPSPSFGLPEFEFLELYNNSEDFFNLNGWTFVNTTSEKVLPDFVLQPGAYVILCDAGAAEEYEIYGDVIGVSSFTALTNGGDSLSLRNELDEVIDIVVYDDDWYDDAEKDDGGWTLEQINPQSPCSGQINWTASNFALGGTPGTENSVFDLSPDITAPEYLGFMLSDSQTVQLQFNEPLNSSVPDDVDIDFGTELTVESIELSIDNQSVIVALVEEIQNGVAYPFSMANISDCSGNGAGMINDEIVLGFDPEPGDILISEIMADPSPPQGLPDAEYVEFFNNSEKLIELGNCDFSGATFSGQALIAPGEYRVALASANQQNIAFYSTAIPMEGFSTTFLTNSGKELILKNAEGITVDSLSYTIEWYTDDSRDDGGWSLELINPNDPCSDISNWSVSNASQGGTPGEVNSIFSEVPDSQGPGLTSIFVPGPQFIQLNFSEPIDFSSLEIQNLSLSDGLGISDFSALNDPVSSVLITLSPSMEEGIRYELSLEDVLDCWGNLNEFPLTGSFAVPEPGEPGDIVVNEILSNPFDDGEDYIELYNRSDKNISLFGWKLANEDEGAPANERIITEFDVILFPGDYLAVSSSIGGIVSNYPNAAQDRLLRMESLPSYSNSEGVVYLLDPLDEVIDRVPYFEDQHYPLLDDLDGVSLERLDYDRDSEDFGNWHSAAESENFGTPGYQNSQFFTGVGNSAELSINPEVFSPDNDGYQDVALIQYSLDEPGYTGTITIYDDLGRKVRTITRNDLLGLEGVYSWNGFDDNQQKAEIGIYVVVGEFFTPQGNTELLKVPCVLGHRLD